MVVKCSFKFSISVEKISTSYLKRDAFAFAFKFYKILLKLFLFLQRFMFSVVTSSKACFMFIVFSAYYCCIRFCDSTDQPFSKQQAV